MSVPAIATPCVNICVVDPMSALCIGCGRTIAEIAAWGDMSAEERNVIMAGLGERLQTARSREVGGGRLQARVPMRGGDR